ncbi:BMP family ABC transporter substrate-binding protein [Borrelia anserina]|uniref:BMP family ABC transporter substrate-binding protein n=1 Tax=Borrelia anserina TaxID=143 RepID=UPI00202A4118|nr:BMP family ABC transporter substrate-binding protein [Borrelia anserina]
MNKFMLFISLVLTLGYSKKLSTSCSLQRPAISLIVNGTFDGKSFGGDDWNSFQMLKENFGVELVGEASTSSAYDNDLEALKDKGSTIIWGVGFVLQEVIQQAAVLNKDVNYGSY